MGNKKSLFIYAGVILIAGLLLISFFLQNGKTPPVISSESDSLRNSNRGAVSQSAAMLWTNQGQQRDYDAIILKENNNPTTWAEGMNTEMRRWLVGKADTMALYGEPVIILERREDWIRVVAENHKTSLDSRGYPGWMPAVHLIQNELFLDELDRLENIVVFNKKTFVYAEPELVNTLKEVSYLTRLPLLEEQDNHVKVRLADGKTGYLASSGIKKASELKFSPNDIVNEANRFLGVRYLWAGSVSYGFDCSGYTMRLYQSQGISIPRDADEQALEGIDVDKRNLRPGDLVFFAKNRGRGPINHVGMYIGNGNMIHAPNSNSSIRVESIYNTTYGNNYWGARRYAP